MANKTKFKDTKFGQKLFKAIPDAVGLIGDALPDNGVFGIAKNLIKMSPLSNELKAELQSELTQAHEAFIQDTQDARANETARDTSENSSWLSKNIHEMIAILVVVPWVGLLIYSFVMVLNNRDSINLDDIKMLFSIFGITNVVSLILGYLYGRSTPQK